MTNSTSNQRGITDNQVSSFFSDLEGVNELNLWDVSLMPSGHGHYKIKSTWNVNGQEIQLMRTTSNMQLVDAWKSGMQDLYEDGEYGYDNWDKVVESILSAIDAEDSIYEAIED